jgi:LPS O-antigen subunit length determinant protein (WzzB/FepE family)
MRQAVAEDEIDLLSVWDALAHRKYLIAAAVALGIAAGVAFAMLVRPVYESRALLQIGRLGELGHIQNADEIVQHLTQVRQNTEGTAAAQLSSADEIVEGTILIAARGASAEDARAFLAAEIDGLVRKHAALFEDVNGRKIRAKEALSARKATLERDAAELGQRVDAVVQRNPELGAVLTQDRVRLGQELAELDEKLAALDLELAPMATWPTRVVRQPTLPARPEGKGRAFYILGGGAAGLVLGIFAALTLDALRPRVSLRR